ncbi:MAG: DUF4416 family protein [Candidatus Hinthialibacter antarcticus]|nr:DUF4416 family protein [Candidatus Hinthialibacter antarcticus]
MTAVQPVKKVKPIFGVLYKDPAVFAQVVQRIENHFGPADFFSAEHPFVETEYYQEEMGPDLIRRYFSLQPLIYPDALVHMKHLSNQWEEEFSADGKRAINLDPGYIHGAKLVLASCKNFSHRVYLGRGVYGEVTMRFENGEFTRLPWTYQDYWNHRSDLQSIRDILIKQIKEPSE